MTPGEKESKIDLFSISLAFLAPWRLASSAL